MIYEAKFDIVKILKYFFDTPIKAFEKIALDEKAAESLQAILRKIHVILFRHRHFEK